MYQIGAKNNLETYINSQDVIVVFSPHPDDDVIGLGGTLQKLNKENVYIAYMTDGSHGYNKSDYEFNPRIMEATLALKVLGHHKTNINFLPLPFYQNKIISKLDYDILDNYLDKIQPDHIFVCNDSDPNKTHDKCYEIIRRSVLNTNLKYVWLYNSAWGKWDNVDDQYCISLFDNYCMENKKKSIMIHDSQDPPIVHDEDTRPFYNRLDNKYNSELGLYEEKFKLVTVDHFKSMPRTLR